ncbi:MAG: hypothetical protein KGD74_08645 [Candidatus Lokiarchaeota archaeon]|nr:hypothetical protein [Candidatus Lokiarchaeota archaeon]
MAQVIFISKKTVRDAWLSAVAQVLYNGDDIRTEYDKKEDPPSKDATVLIEIEDPLSDPIMRRGKLLKIKSKYGNSYEVYGSMADIYLIGSIQSGYIEEILEGKADHFIYESGLSFPYSYYDRIYNYTPFSIEDTILTDYDIDLYDTEFIKNHKKLIEANKIIKNKDSIVWKLKNGLEIDLDKKISDQIGIKNIPIGLLKFPKFNQMKFLIQKLKDNSYTRRAQIVTWRQYVDPYRHDPPCLQRIYFRIKNGQLSMQTTWRSRDLFRAWEANVNGMIRMQRNVANELGVEMGHYLDFSNSLHIYGSTKHEVLDMFERMKNKGTLPKDVINLMEENENNNCV